MTGRAFLATFRAIFADSSALMLLIGSCILYAFFYPSAYSGEVPVRMPVAVVDMDHSGTSRALESRLAALQQAEVAARPPSPAAALDQLRERRVSAIVVIPEGFERRILSGGQGVVVLYGNGAYLLRTSTALAGVGAALVAGLATGVFADASEAARLSDVDWQMIEPDAALASAYRDLTPSIAGHLRSAQDEVHNG